MIKVLLAEDNPGDVLLIGEALRGSGVEFELVVQQDGELMLTHIDQIDSGRQSCPDVVLLDLNLPKAGGHTLLERLRSSERFNDVPVIIVTSSDSPTDRELAVRLGASDYFRKAHDFDEYMRLGSVIRSHTATA